MSGPIATVFENASAQRLATGAGLLFAFLYLRSLPFAWHVRFFGHCLWARLFASRPPSIFEASTLSFMCWPDDIDFNLHMGNSSYNKICDFGRYAHFARFGFGNVSGANGGVFMRFKRSIEPMQAYSLGTRIVCFDDKWVFVEHRFTGADGRVKAAGLCKIVLFGKDSRPERPAEAFRRLGYSDEMDALEAGSKAEVGRSTTTGVMLGMDCIEAAVMMLSAEKHFGKD